MNPMALIVPPPPQHPSITAFIDQTKLAISIADTLKTIPQLDVQLNAVRYCYLEAMKHANRQQEVAIVKMMKAVMVCYIKIEAMHRLNRELS